MFKKLYLLLSLILLPTLLLAQSGTTANMNGIVRDADGKGLAGATIKVTHIPSGTIAGAIATKTGRYNVVGLRVGGPYEINVTMIGYQAFKKEGITLSINQNLNLDVNLSQTGITTKDVVVTGERNAIISSDRTGAAQYVGEVEIKNLPTIARSIHDYSRLSPLIVSSTSEGSNVGGRSNKFNNIQVDGAIISDNFGLSASGSNGGQTDAQPISLDAVQEFQVSIAPFDVRQGGFTGGLINVITRSGSNYLDGSAYFFGRNQSFVGKSFLKNAAGERTSYPDFSENQFGLRVGGPIVKDNLFFFANVDFRNRTDPQRIGISDSTFPINFAVPKSTLEEIKNIFINTYKYDPGDLETYQRQTQDYKIFLKLDYNLNEKNRLSVRHNYVNAEQGNDVVLSEFTYTFKNREYKFRSQTNQTVLQLNSIVAADMANELKLSYTAVNDMRDPVASKFPSIRINNLGTDGKKSVNLGIDRSSQANALDQNILDLTNNFNWFMGDHVLTAGASVQYITYNNLFIQDFNGTYEFSSINALKSGTPSRYQNSYSLDSLDLQPRAKFSHFQIAAYLQDEWNITSTLKINAGVRIDKFAFLDTPLENPTLIKESYNITKDSSKVYSTSVMPNPIGFSPRLGFNLDLTGDKSTQIRGGVGIFSGKSPGVWISNQYSNTGMDFGRLLITDAATLSSGFFNPNSIDSVPTPLNNAKLKAIKTTAINLTDKDLKMPQILRLNLAVDQQLPLGFIGTFEFLYGKTLYDMDYVNLNRQLDTSADYKAVSQLQGRPYYSTVKPNINNFTDIILMTNTTEGDQLNISAQLQKPFHKGFLPDLSINLAYTFSRVRDVNPGTSSVATSNWQFIADIDPNHRQLGTSIYEIPHRFFANVSYTFDYKPFESIGTWSTTVGLFFEGRSGQPLSLTYFGDANNDRPPSSSAYNDLIYVPLVENDTKSIITNPQIQDPKYPTDATKKIPKYYSDVEKTKPISVSMMNTNLNSFINSSEKLNSQRGKIMDKNSLNQPWRNSIDLRISQVIPTFRGQKIEISLDIFNVLNLMNPEWGIMKFVSNQNYSLINYEGYVWAGDLGKPIDASNPTGPVFTAADLNKMKIAYNSKTSIDDIFNASDLVSRWQMQLGIRYSF